MVPCHFQKNHRQAMKIAITIDELGIGGAQNVVYALVRHIDTEKYNITIICTDGRVDSLLEQKMLYESKIKNYSIIFLQKCSLHKTKTSVALFNKILNHLKQIFIDLKIIPELNRALDAIKPDLIHAHQHGMLAAYWAILHKVPVITTIHTNPNAAFHREIERAAFKLTLFRKCIKVIAISKYNHERIKSYWHLDDTNSLSINNGIDIDNYYHTPHEVFTFINSSRQDENKNQALILYAFVRLCTENRDRPLKLFLVGDGETHEALVSLAGNLGIADRVMFTGFVASPAEYLALSDVYVSSAHREGLSLSALEAMAARLPVIATDVGGVRDLAQENGFLIQDNDIDELCEAMKALMDNPDMCRIKGDISRSMVNEYSAWNMVKGYSAVYDEVFFNKH
jgi:glycosyltransferase involved in cell wall biosynthesis